LQSLLAQQGCPAPPQLKVVPLLQTIPAAVFWPEATHVVALQHPPPRQVLPAQQICPAPPHPTQLPALQMRPAPLQLAPEATHVVVWESQQPLALQVEPAQHGCPAPPQVRQVPP
jgi:hypothetical protein